MTIKTQFITDIQRLKEIQEELKNIPTQKFNATVEVEEETVFLSFIAESLQETAAEFFEDEKDRLKFDEVVNMINLKSEEVDGISLKYQKQRKDLITEQNHIKAHLDNYLPKNEEFVDATSYYSLLLKHIDADALQLIETELVNLGVAFKTDHKRIMFATSGKETEHSRLSLLNQLRDSQSVYDLIKSSCQKSKIDFSAKDAPLQLVLQ